MDRVHGIEPVKSAIFAPKAQIRRALEASGIPYTIVSSNFLDGWFLPSLAQPEPSTPHVPPRDKFIIIGDGNPKGISCIFFDYYLDVRCLFTLERRVSISYNFK